MALTLPFDFGRGLARVITLRSFFENNARHAYNYLRLTGVTVDTNTVVIGTDTWEVDTLGAAGTALGATGLPNQATDTDYTWDAAHGLAVGQMIKCESEIMLVKAVMSTVKARLGRARCGTSAAAHAGTTGTFKSAVTAGRIALGVLSTSAANFCTAFIAEINAGDRSTKNDGSNQFRAIAFGTTSVFLVAKKKGVNTTAMTETLANGTLDNATAVGGAAEGLQRRIAGARVPTADEVTAGILMIPCEFTPSVINVHLIVTASGVPGVAWNGAATFVAPSGDIPGYVKLDNTGTTDWAASDTLHYEIVE